jgi:hypothetical protein
MKKVYEKPTTNPVDVARLLSKVFEIPLAGISLLEGDAYKPYINALGLQCAWDSHPEVLRIVNVTFVSMYKAVGDSAIVLVEADYLQPTGAVSEDIQPVLGASRITEIGTATPSNLAPDFKDYPNEIALTRAMNRMLRRVLLPVLYKTLDKNLVKLTSDEQLTVLGAIQKSKFGTVTIEEIGGKSEGQDLPEEFMTNELMAGIKPLLERIVQATTKEEMNAIGEDIGKVKETFTAQQMKKLRDTFGQKMKELI